MKKQIRFKTSLKKELRQGHRKGDASGRGMPEFAVCSLCKSVYYKKSWHHAFPVRIDGDEMVRFLLCPACRMVKEGRFEGQVTISALPEAKYQEILARIEHVGERAFADDPLDRIISVTRKGNAIEVLTTENQLALRIGREVRQLLGKAKRDVRFSEAERIIRVRVVPR